MATERAPLTFRPQYRGRYTGARVRATSAGYCKADQDQKDVILFVLALNQLVIELLKVVTTPINRIATNAISSPYSVIAMPFSSPQNCACPSASLRRVI